MQRLIIDHPDLYAWIVLPLLIFAARSVDMTLSTLRIVCIAQGRRLLAPLIGFVESLIWLLVIGQVLKHLANPMCVVAYAAGFATGNLVGLQLEQRLAFGMRLLRIILREHADELTEALRRAGFGVTVVAGVGLQGPVSILFTLARRRDLDRAIGVVSAHDPKAFFTIEDVRQAGEGFLPALNPLPWPWSWMPWRTLRKSG